MLYISILILILFLMYVYKKKCDEDYYLSIIRSTQQQFMYQNPPRQNYPFHPSFPYINNNYMGSVPYPNNNSLTPNFSMNNYNYNNPFKTPERRNYNYSYNNYYNNMPYNINERTPSPNRIKAVNKYGYQKNVSKKHALEDQILYNKLNNINGISVEHKNQNLKNINDEFKYNYNQNDRSYNPNYNRINKKVFKLEDFLSESKKNDLSDKFNRASTDDLN